MSAHPQRNILFLAAPGFMVEGDGPFYCGDCIAIEGLLSLFPVLRDRLDVRHVPFPRPRQAIIERLGEAHQSLPVLLLTPDSVPGDLPFQTRGGIRFLDNEADIRRYLSSEGGVAQQL